MRMRSPPRADVHSAMLDGDLPAKHEFANTQARAIESGEGDAFVHAQNASAVTTTVDRARRRGSNIGHAF